MTHSISDADDIPMAPPVLERRLAPDRRLVWRGGRRDSDWLERPPGALARLERAQALPARWLRTLTSVQLW